MRFYVPDLSRSNSLPEEEAQHALKVLRLRPGDAIELTDGCGKCCSARITQATGRSCSFEILSENHIPNKNYSLHIGIAPTKNIERFEYFVEKAVEIGVDCITPILCRFSERRILKQERLEKIIVAASKQSLRSHFPRVSPLTPVESLIATASEEQKFIAHCYDTEKRNLKDLCRPACDTLVLIGPEGDFSPEELQEAFAANFQAVSLASNRLRTETAGVVACHSVIFVND